jgi:hypothetical protein
LLLQAVQQRLFVSIQERWQPGVPDKFGFVLDKSCITEDMIGMDMSIDDISDRKIGNCSYCLSQSGAYLIRPARIDHGNTFLAYNESDVSDIAIVFLIEIMMLADMDIDPISDLLHAELSC